VLVPAGVLTNPANAAIQLVVVRFADHKLVCMAKTERPQAFIDRFPYEVASLEFGLFGEAILGRFPED
jgi:hypothetical protein